MSRLLNVPWLNVSMDFCGPIPTDDYLIAIIDEFFRFPMVEIFHYLSYHQLQFIQYKLHKLLKHSISTST